LSGYNAKMIMNRAEAMSCGGSTLKSFNESESRLPSLAKSSANGLDLTLSATKTNNKLAALNLSGYNAKMIMNRAEAMSCGGCHQNSSNAEINHHNSLPQHDS
jgi:hypothetical protein